MGSVKEYMMELSDKLGKEFEDITDRDMELDFYNKAQETFWNDNSTQDELERAKPFLPTKSYDQVKFYDDETGRPKFKIGSILMDNGTFFLVVR